MIKYLDKYYGILSSGTVFFFKEEDNTRVSSEPLTDAATTNKDIYTSLETLYRQNGLYFKPDDSQRVAESWYMVKGCERCERLTNKSILLKNYYQESCELHFETEDDANRWQYAIEANAK